MHTAAKTALILDLAKSQGFDLCGVVRAEKFPELTQFEQWLAAGYAGEMRYLNDERRCEPSLTMQDLRCVIVCALNYNTAYPYSVDSAASVDAERPRGWVSRYAWGRDYHEVLWEKLNSLDAAIRRHIPGPFST